MKKQKPVLAWHFIAGDKLRDGTTAPEDGEWLEFAGTCVMCKSGLHASRNPFDALQYAPGSTLCLVEVDQISAEQTDKLVCSRRKIIARMDAAELCWYFARMQAVSCLDNWQANPDQCVLDWLMGDNSQQKAAAKSAWSAWSAARAARAVSAAWSAGSAAWSAGSAGSAARSAWSAGSAARSAARDEFTQLVYECFSDFLP